ncbi:glutathione S-transferase theta-1 [Amia ocellicauda]|uniref:glutathione S-transferase theta-1 n=1 Tax=Amia ocellicauda TaxID=2972642 RepID=UPI0034638A94|nr:GSTT1 transferase [Amia calva]
MVLQLYYDLLSQPCRAILLFVRTLGVPYHGKEVSLLKGENRSEEFSRVNPMMQIPVIVDDGFILTESVAIMKYIAARYNAPDHWYPADLQTQSKVDEYLAWQHFHTRQHAMRVFLSESLLPKLSGEPARPSRLSSALNDLEVTLDLLDSKFLKDKRFLCANDISIADLLAVCELAQPMGGGRDVLQGRDRLLQWRQRVVSFVGEPLYQEVHMEILGGKQQVGPPHQALHMKAFAERVCDGPM